MVGTKEFAPYTGAKRLLYKGCRLYGRRCYPI
jgi:hypothetical protein